MPKYHNPRKTWRYSDEFKIKAMEMSLQGDFQIQQVAEGLGIHPFMLSRWNSGDSLPIFRLLGSAESNQISKLSPYSERRDMVGVLARLARLERRVTAFVPATEPGLMPVCR